MKTKRTLLLVNSLYLSLYLVFATIYYIVEGDTLGYEEHPFFASIYIFLVLVHAGIVLVGVLFQWWGYAAKKSGPLVFASILFFVAGLELVLLLMPALAMIVAVILNAIAGKPERIKPAT